jgi:hypothetical protein
LPAGTAEVALLVEDPDAPGGRFVHWVLWGSGRAPVSCRRGSCPPNAKGVATTSVAAAGTARAPVQRRRAPLHLHPLRRVRAARPGSGRIRRRWGGRWAVGRSPKAVSPAGTAEPDPALGLGHRGCPASPATMDERVAVKPGSFYAEAAERNVATEHRTNPQKTEFRTDAARIRTSPVGPGARIGGASRPRPNLAQARAQ